MMCSIVRCTALLLFCASLATAQAPKTPPLPKPFATPSAINSVNVIGWPKDRTPSAPAGFRVTAFARDIESPRWIYVLPGGDVLVAQSRTLPKKKKKEDDDPEKKKVAEVVEQGFKKSKT